MTRVDDKRINKSYTYAYDNGGNLTSVSEYAYTTGQLGNVTATHTYSYDAIWKDKLLSYDGQAITYDTIGNPTSYMGAAMTWSNGRELSSIVDGNDTISYTYTTDGIRLSKTVNNITTNYVLDGSTILSEATGNETLNYYYDSTGTLQQIGYKKGTAAEVYYLAVHNGQGDIIAIYNAGDSTLVGTYTYDAWGKILSANTAGSTSDPNGILTKNPFRYRGYYYDRETGFYYLQSRYYHPGLGRFLNADTILGEMGNLLGNNLFIYCQGNPVMYIDPSGHKIEFSSDMTEEQKRQYEEALRYLENSKQFEILYKLLLESEETIIIEFTDKFGYTGYYPNTNTLSWNPLEGLVLSDEKSVQSPALGLAHEMGHAYQDLSGLNWGNNFIGTYRSEGNNLMLWEIPIAKELGEQIRKYYFSGIKGRKMSSPTEKVVPKRSWTWYLNPFNLLLGN